MVTEKLFSFLLLFFFITSPLEDVFAFNQSHCSCRSLPAIEASASDEIIIPIYFFADEYGGILGISPVTDDLFVWAYSYSSETSETIQALNYAYDSVGNITKIEDYSSTTAKIVNFGYDALYRLSTASTTNASTSPNYLQTWGYNAIGNISTTSAIGDYQYDGHTGTNYANPHAATSIGSMTLNYDRNGNLGTTTQGTTQWLYNWDYKNQLTQAASGTATTTYGYDHNGRRVTMAVNGLSTTTYPTKNYNVQGATTTKHIYAGGELIAEVIGNGNSTSTYIIHTDHLGGVHVVTNASGTAVSTSDYYPYGDLRVNVGSLNEQRRFTGHEYDSGPNLSYMNARYYTGTRGQFLSQDPTFWDGVESHLDDPQQMNSYSYARNNPINVKDPNGRQAVVSDPQQFIQLVKETIVLLQAVIAVLASSYVIENASQIAGTVGRLAQDVTNFVSSAFSGGQRRPANATILGGSQTRGSTPITTIPGLSIPGYSGRTSPYDLAENKSDSVKKPTSANQLDKKVQRGQAPNSVDRVDPARNFGDKPHIEFKDGNALNNDGTWRHGGRPLTNAEQKFIKDNSWSLPKN
ncbi:MAG: hypothetical protein A2047_03770 [Omnitrophica bacterium GWA2_41_15]|nr:MAG: hypothetical protein A2047_03770 [Omnitrophica bacterium GWA2_41_15]